MLTIRMAALAAAMAATPATASTLVLYDLDAATGRRVGSSPYADQELARLERQGLIRSYGFPVDDGGAETTSELQIVSPQPLLPTGGIRTLNGRVVWRVTTQVGQDGLRYRNVITSEQGFSNGLGSVTDYQRTEVAIEGAIPPRGSGGSPTIMKPYSNNRGERMLVGYLRP